MTTRDDDASTEEHINPATGYVETTLVPDNPSPDEAEPRLPSSPAADDDEHLNPATGFIETTASEE